MKRIALFLSALALGLSFTACSEKDGDIDFSTALEDGCYVGGPATGFDEIVKETMMVIGINEASDKTPRSGMYEKYIILEADKDFYLVWKNGKQEVRYGADLEVYDASIYDENPEEEMYRGELVTVNAPAMRVDKTGMYHIILDLNLGGDLPMPQIVLAPCNWGIRGGGDNNTTRYTDSEPTVEGKKWTWVMDNVELVSDRNFKFVHCNGWKVNLDAAGTVKAETSFGEGLQYSMTNISVDKTGKYRLTLTYELKAGATSESFSYTAELLEYIAPPFPDALFINGGQFGGEGWDWNAETIYQLASTPDTPGVFRGLVWFDSTKEFKFAPARNWDTSFGSMSGSDIGIVVVEGGNAKVEADGIYYLVVDYTIGKIIAQPAVIKGIGQCFGGVWTDDDTNTNIFTVNEGGKTMSITVKNDPSETDGLRMCAVAPQEISAKDWWKHEFNLINGKIVLRDNGANNEGVMKSGDTVAAGQIITLDFSNGTGTIK